MKKIITICAVIIMTASLFAQAPNKMSYQAVIRNNSNALVTNSTVGMRISILQTSPSGTAVYSETQTPTTNANGLASIEMGGGTVVSGNFTKINWANGPYFVKTETDPTGGTSYSIIGTSQFLSVPYALYAANSGAVNGNICFSHYVGEIYGGGIVFHVYKDTLGVEHGLIASLADISSSSVWSNLNALCALSNGQPPQLSPVNGSSNTQLIINQPGHITSAALLCTQYNGGGYNDWYLPAVWELRLLYNSAFAIEKILGPAGKLSFVDYWSSTEEFNSIAWTTSFSSGWSTGSHPKSELNRVRAIRSF
jgi:hypothetical protein